MAKKQSSQLISSLAGKVLASSKSTPTEKKLAASVLSQDEKKGR